MVGIRDSDYVGCRLAFFECIDLACLIGISYPCRCDVFRSVRSKFGTFVLRVAHDRKRGQVHRSGEVFEALG